MTDAAAPPVLAFRARSTLERLALDPDLEIGAGGEAIVYGVPGDDALVAKLYHEPAIERARKLTAMLSNPPAMPEGTAIAWPADLLLDARGRFAGFVMPRAEGPRLFEFYNPVTRRETAPGFHAGLLHRAGRNLAAAFHALHAAGYVVGDVNESNFLVSPHAAVTLVDADSLQVADAESGSVFRSRVGKPEFTPPELQGVSFGEVDRGEAHDRFGLAVLLFLLLMEGTHPFAARFEGEGDALPVEARIRRGLFAHAGRDDCRPPRLSPRFDALHLPLQALFLRAFVDGHADPAARPSPAAWRDALAAAEAALAVCAANPLHRHGAHLSACPWCERTALLGGRDPFPSSAVAIARAPRPPRPRRVVSPPPAPASTPAPVPVVTPYGTRRVLQHVAARPTPAVFGPSGVLNSLEAFLPAAALATQGGTFGIVAGLVALLAVIGLVVTGGKHIRVSTVVLAVVLAAFLSIVADLVPSADSYDTLPTDVYDPGQTFVAPSPAPAPVSVRTVDDFMLPEIRSASVNGDPQTLPAAPAAASGDDAHAFGSHDLDRLPRLRNPREASRMLAAASAHVRNGQVVADTAVLWLRVGLGGRVTASQVVSSTHRKAAEAAELTVPYLRFTPGEKDGREVPAWVSQRMVIVP